MTIRKSILSTTALVAMLGTFALPAAAQDVQLTGKDNNINIAGKLLEIRDGNYVVETDLGEFVINQDIVDCIGDGCPKEQEFTFAMEVAAPDEIAEILVPILVEGYAASNLDAEAQLFDEHGQPVDTESHDVSNNRYGEEKHFALQLTDLDGEDVATFGIHTANGKRLFESLASGEASVIFTDQAARKSDRTIVSEGRGGNLRDFDQERVIAVDGYAMIVNPLNGVPSLSLDQARDIMSGDITNWSEVGGSNAPINVYSFDPHTEAFHHIEQLLFRKSKKSLTENSAIITNKSELSTAIMEDVAGFGIISYSSKRGTRAVPVKSACGLIQDPTDFNLKTEEYSLQRRVIAYSRSDAEGYGRELIDYLDTDALDGLVAKAGFIDLSITSDPQTRAAERLATELEEGESEFETELVEDLLKNMNTHERLSTTFRFAPGSSKFDNKAERDLARMLAYLKENQPSEVVVVGFTDNKGPFDPNLMISQERAETVLNRLIDADKEGDLTNIPILAKGFGELEPVACNTSPRGRATNRRVEIWIKK